MDTFDECGITSPGACIGEGMAGFIDLVVGQSLNKLLTFVGETLLSTPTLDELPRVGELWEQSRLIVVATYSLFVIVAGLVVMAHETVQTRYSVRETLPRLVIGFVAANLSLPVGDQAIRLANGLSVALLGGLDPQQAGQGLGEVFVAVVLSAVATSGVTTGLLSLVLVILLVRLLVGYAVRVGLTVILLAGAPLALMFHGLPHTEGIAFWFWRSGAAILGIQVGQSLALICALKVFLEPGGFRLFSTKTDGTVNLIVVIALVWVLVMIPTWMMRQVKIGSGKRSFVVGVARSYVFGRAAGALGLRRNGIAVSRNAVHRSAPNQHHQSAPIKQATGARVILAAANAGQRTKTAQGQQPTAHVPGKRPMAHPVQAPQFRPPVQPQNLNFRPPTTAPPTLPRRMTTPPAPPTFRAPKGGGRS
ncbi:hypothetical protein ABZX92_12680 [Lentzea sp. NPDC006480]|uniref:hypothetical protein n=1 Tax=Lentzea sp. NPDC006480 TaxID=3157176 RepID=UPI0033A7AAB2